LRIGEWKAGKFLGEKLKYTTERIYGIDISRHQHEKGRKRYGIDFSKLRIASLGKRHDTQGRTFPVSFIYIKSTEGTTIRNRYFMTDYMKAKKAGIHVGAYHFFSLKSSAELQAKYFVNHTLFRKGDFPPVLDVEPTDAQIRKIGGSDALMKRIRIFMEYVEKRTGMRPILYVSQMFVNRHMANATDIKQKYNVWIARYSQYKPDVKLAYWQLCPDGRVDGITGEVDVNVFNGYQDQFTEFVKTGFHK
jgi:lysozyme